MLVTAVRKVTGAELAAALYSLQPISIRLHKMWVLARWWLDCARGFYLDLYGGSMQDPGYGLL